MAGLWLSIHFWASRMAVVTFLEFQAASMADSSRSAMMLGSLIRGVQSRMRSLASVERPVMR